MSECLDKLVESSRLVYLGIPVSIFDNALPKISKLSSLRYLDISGEGMEGFKLGHWIKSIAWKQRMRS